MKKPNIIRTKPLKLPAQVSKKPIMARSEPHRFELDLDPKLFAHLTLRSTEARLTRAAYIRQLLLADIRMFQALKNTKYPKETTNNA
jgi:hypothetical protein